MTYGLPAHGELNWDVKVSASIEAVKATADAAETPTGAQSKANAAQSAAISTAAADATSKANAVQANLSTHAANVANPHAVTKSQVGLGNVDNTSDANKPISTATQTALDGKQPLDSDLTTIAALNSATSGVLASDGAGWIGKTYAALKTALSLTKSDVGLGNVDNTSDANKPVSTAQQTALDAKRDKTRTINAQTGTTYTFVLTDADKWVTFNNASAVTVTVPPNSSVAFSVGTQIEGVQLGAGQVTFAAGAGVTLRSTPGLGIAAQYGTYGLTKIATDEWVVYGRLS